VKAASVLVSEAMKMESEIRRDQRYRQGVNVSKVTGSNPGEI